MANPIAGFIEFCEDCWYSLLMRREAKRAGVDEYLYEPTDQYDVEEPLTFDELDIDIDNFDINALFRNNPKLAKYRAWDF